MENKIAFINGVEFEGRLEEDGWFVYEVNGEEVRVFNDGKNVVVYCKDCGIGFVCYCFAEMDNDY